jgi:molybdopterin molybdotransferase
MDGYAISSADLEQSSTILKVSQRIAAGEMGTKLSKGEAARIFTGAPIPEGSDAVVMQENCEVNGGKIKVLQNVNSGENLREAGEDVKSGKILLVAGHRLLPQDIGLAASTGA